METLGFNSVGLEITVILLLILANGFFAGSEIAVLSARRSRINQWFKEGRKRATLIHHWLKEPEAFLATVQVGVTIVGVLASAIGGVTAVRHLEPLLRSLPVPPRWAEHIAITLVVMGISFTSLVLGELVPKSLALTYRERMAVWAAYPIYWLSVIATPLVSVLTWATRAVLFCFGQKEIPKELFVSEEEIRFLIKEGGSQGIFDQTEQAMIPKVFDFADLKIRELMLPRDKITAIDLKTPRDRLLEIVADEAYTRLPVYREDLDHVVGVLHMKDLIHMINLGEIIILHDLLRQPVFVRENDLAKELLKMFQKRHLHMAIVQNGEGKTVGLVTLEDLIERIVGDIRDEHDTL